MLKKSGQAGADFEINEEMVRAGVLVAREHPLGASLEELVRAVYLAMWLESSSTSVSASSIIAVK
jgi:hypothetical protein